MKIIRLMTIGMALCAGWLASCSDDDTVGSGVLLRPVASMEVNLNKAQVSWKMVEGATEYIVEVYRVTDNGNELVQTETVPGDQSSCVISLEWEYSYQFKVKCKGNGCESGYWETDVTGVLYRPLAVTLGTNTAIDTQAKITWEPNDTIAITALVAEPVAASDEEEGTEDEQEEAAQPAARAAEAKTYPVSTEEYQAGFKILDGLEPETKYRVSLYSGEAQTSDTYLGRVEIATVKAENLEEEFQGQNVIRVPAGNEGYFNTVDLTTMPDGTVFILPGGQTFTMDESFSLSHSVTFITELSLEGNATIQTPKMAPFANPKATDVTTFSYLRCKRISFKSMDDLSAVTSSSFSGDYVLCTETQAFNIDEITFTDCYFENFRGGVRPKVDGSHAGTVTFKGCEFNGIGGYGIITNDGKKNTTFDQVIMDDCTVRNTWCVFNMTKAAVCQTVQLTNTTFCYTPASEGSAFIFRFEGNAAPKVSVENCVFGAAMMVNGSAPVLNTIGGGDGRIDYNGASYTAVNSYAANDFATSKGSLNLTDAGKSTTSLFSRPAEGNFQLSEEFEACSTTGATKWRR